MNIGEVIVSLRKQSRIRQKELANSLGITATYLSLIETNQTKASISLLSRIANYFNLPLNALLFKAFDVNSITDAEKRKYFKAATPIVDALIEYLLPDATAGEKDSSVKTKLRTSRRKNARLKV
jgi:transcriptional regulator with XRE-family HTH domain